VFLTGIAAAASLVQNAARADKASCTRAYVGGQELHQAQKLTEARERLIECAQRTCPTFMQTECTRWLAEVEAALPTVVLDVHDASGRALTATQIWVDDRPAPLPGASAFPIDPGEHVFRAQLSDGREVTTRALVREGEKSRAVVLELPGAAPPNSTATAPPSATTSPPPARSTGLPLGAWVLGGVGVVALASYAFFGISGLTKQLDLHATCSPRCSPDDLSSLRRTYLAADISLGVAALAGVGFAWIVLARPSGDGGNARRDARGLRLDFALDPRGRVLARGTF
jgi:hypothetical protein